ncbi:MAG: AAA family ATPase [Syntrophobacterales bacterium]|nr:AAA family ATPase [Syntrophobacterales bacterium]
MKIKEKGRGGKSESVREDVAPFAVPLNNVETLLPYSSFQVRRFRCLKEIVIEPLEQVNLITGKNDVGKTTLLEALFLHIGETNPELALRIGNWRGLSLEMFSSWRSLFWQFEDDKSIELAATTIKGIKRSLTITAKAAEATVIEELSPKEGADFVRSSGVEITFDYAAEKGKREKVVAVPYQVGQGDVLRFELRMKTPVRRNASLSGIFLNSRGIANVVEENRRFSQLIMKKRDHLLLEALQIIEPRLEKIEILSPQGAPMMWGHLKGCLEPIPLSLFGDGTRRLASLILAIGEAQGGVVLVDEIENGIHHSVLKDMWRVVAAAASLFNTQVFATTHSHECLVAAHEAYMEREHYRFRLHRLDRKNGDIRAVTYDRDSLQGALSIPLEVRG